MGNQVEEIRFIFDYEFNVTEVYIKSTISPAWFFKAFKGIKKEDFDMSDHESWSSLTPKNKRAA